MNDISPETDLRNTIIEQEKKHAIAAEVLKGQMYLMYEQLTPSNIVKSILHEPQARQKIGNEVLSVSVALTAGYISKVLFERVSHGPFKKILGSALMYGITNLTLENPETIKSMGHGIMKIIQILRKPT